MNRKRRREHPEHHPEQRPEQRPAIVLAAFGTAEAGAVGSILNIRNRVAGAFPGCEVRLAFTSGVIRNIWRERAADSVFREENAAIPDDIYRVESAAAAIADLREKCRRNGHENAACPILVQSLHVADGGEYQDLVNLVRTFGDIKTGERGLHPFPQIGMVGVGAPALGAGDGDRAQCLERAAAAIGPLAAEAAAGSASLVLMGHGGDRLNQDVFPRFLEVLRKRYGGDVHLGAIKGGPFAEDIAGEMKAKANAPKTVLLAPLMVVAGGHVRQGMAGDGAASWKNIFARHGFSPVPHLAGLGSNDSWADIYVERLKALEKEIGLP